MRRTTWAAVACIAAIAAGCGSSPQTTPTTPPTTPAGATTGSGSGGAMAHTGPVGTIGPPTTGSYDARKPGVTERIDSALVKYFSTKGFTGVTAICTTSNPTTTSCRVTGTNSSGKTSSAVLTISLNATTGLLTVTHAAPG